MNFYYTFKVYEIPQHSSTDDPLAFVCLHGAGQTALSFGLLAQALHQSMKAACCVMAFDARGHDQLVSDLNGVVKETVLKGAVVLVGHSMGGAVVAKAALSGEVGGRPLVGVVVIDVVEGTALAALSGMDRVLESRPKTFKSPEAAIKWAIQSGTLRNAASARISMPSQLVQKEGRWDWRIDLATTQPYWVGWFTGLSEHFLSAKAPKLLLLAGTDRLDKTLMIAHMQGKG
ncbi:Protein phosphatase methylesterase 1, variant 2 [Entomophthora muscae]|uniref:Protein phosphatase methylesterase 1, variant 2 n=1 Tax=Entomophthora muscae TaxID=34485 RepID=A0ACC2RDD9_9FUNG|nr:Protein phosphatase methylesterase 1, variant 2 [Entomophthora muscae]